MAEAHFDNPTKPELAILKLLWSKKELNARQVHTAVAVQFGWTYSTLRTVMERMVEKGLLTKRSEDGVNIYEAEVTKLSMLSKMIADFSTRVLELDAAPAAAFFAESKLLSDKEIDELEQILRKWEEK